MAIYCTYFGIDSHLRTTTICALTPEDGELRTRTFRGNDYGEMAEWMAGFPQPSHGVYESGCTGFVPARMLTRGDTLVEPVASSKLPSSADSRSRKNDRRDAERLARLALAGEVSPVWVPPEQVEGLREPDRATDDLACVREAARQRVNAILCRHGISWDERTPTGRLKKRWGQHFWNWLRSIDLGDAGSQAAYLAALSAAESAEVAYDELRARAEGIARASDPGPPVDAPVCARGAGPPLGARVRRRGGRPLPPLVRAKGHVLLRPRALGELERREPEAGPHLEERLRARAQASHRGCLGPRAGQPGVPQEGRDVSAPRDPRARAGLLGKAPRTSQGAGLPRPDAPRGQHRHGRRDGAHAAPRRQGRAGGRRAGGRGGPRRLSNGRWAMSNEQ